MTALFTEITGQRQTSVALEAHGTVGEVVAEAVSGLRLPVASQRGMALDYAVRTASGALLRPSETLSDDQTRQLLAEGENVVIPRLTAA